ncbi:MAG: sigma-54 dependent transcriptional regulator [Bacteroidales bacterium]
MSKILIIDDEKVIRQTLTEIFEYENHQVVGVEDGVKAIELLKKDSFDVVFCDIKMPGMDGIEVLEKSLSFTSIPFIMISGHGSIDTAVECIKKGAFDYIAKPLDLNRILISLRNATEKTKLVNETSILKKKINENSQIIGNSKALTEVLEMVDKVALTDARVLIMGDNGTGKELIARRIHENSARSKAAFVEVNCAAIPSELIESELFGHEKGSFTSAIKQRKGSFEQADGGSLFLDEIGDMSLSAQAKVLRALQENKITRVGSEKSISVNVRIIAATNKNLALEIAQGRFREDLYHRLSVILIKMPKLNERSEDIPLLINYFIEQICRHSGKAIRGISTQAVEYLQAYTWTGNIRELHNVVERLLILCDKEITLDDVKKYIR